MEIKHETSKSFDTAANELLFDSAKKNYKAHFMYCEIDLDLERNFGSNQNNTYSQHTSHDVKTGFPFSLHFNFFSTTIHYTEHYSWEF